MLPGSSGGYGFQGVGSNAISFAFSLKNMYVNLGPSANVVQMPNYTDFTNLFEQYRITGAEIMLFFNRNAESAATTSSTLPLIAFVDDVTDSTQLTSVADALEYPNCRIIQMGNTRGESPAVRLRVKPKIAVEISDYGVAPAASLSSDPWINTLYPDTPHYAIKGWWDNQTPGAATTPCGEMFIYCKLSFECRRPH